MDFTDPKGNLNYQKCRKVLIVCAKPVDVIKKLTNVEPEPLPEPVEKVDDSAFAAAPAM